MSTLALGLIETRGLVAAIEAADAAAKAASITLVSAELLGGGIVTLRIRGDLGAVQAAVEAGAQAAKRIGEVLAVRVIPRPVDELEQLAPTGERIHKNRVGGLTHTPAGRARIPHSAPVGASSHDIDISVPPARGKVNRPRKSGATKESRRTARTPAVVASVTSVRPAPATTNAAKPAPATTSSGRASMADLEAMSVVKLRQYARSIKNLPIQGRQISIANKTQLLEAIRQFVQ